MSAVSLARRRALQKRSVVSLNLVSLMDIFTILVFFLMVNATEVELLEPAPGIRLPDSMASTRPDPQLVVTLDADGIRFEDLRIGWSEVLAAEGNVVPRLRDAFDAARQRARGASGAPADAPGRISVMGDRGIDYALLKRVLATCAAARLTDVELAVNQLEERST
jgi:biopolymer transport protein ExbD